MKRATITVVGICLQSIPSHAMGNVMLQLNALNGSMCFGSMLWWQAACLWFIVLVSGLLMKRGLKSWKVLYDGHHLENHLLAAVIGIGTMLLSLATLCIMIGLTVACIRSGNYKPLFIAFGLLTIGTLLPYLRRDKELV